MSAFDSYQNLLKEPSGYRDLLVRLMAEIEEDLRVLNPRPEWHAALVYPIETGGKRVRPLLMRLIAGTLLGEAGEQAVRPAAVAIEWLHTYSLVHDDLPSMDNDDFRRGKPTVHKKFGEATAILVGDALLTEAFGILATASNTRWIGPWVKILSEAAGAQGMCLGQWLDLRRDPDVRTVAALKTGKLFQACAAMPLAMTDLPEVENQRWHAWGLELGSVFQAVDDVQDGEVSESQKESALDSIRSRTDALAQGIPGSSVHAVALRAMVTALATRVQ